MNQASSNSSMPKSTAEALKLIQKKGLSISIVSRDNSRSSQPAPAESPVGAKEMKPKQIVSVDKSTKLPIRSSVVTENKATLSQARSMPNALSETRNSSGQTPNSAHFQENIISGVINKTLVPISTSSETRAAQAWNNLPESKLQASCNQIAQSVAENKNLQAGRHVQGQLIYSEGKIQVAKSSPNISEGIKVQSRISQATGQPSHIAGRNAQGNQVKSPMSSPPLEKKVLNTDRQPQNFENLQQRLVSESNQTKFVVSNKVGDVTLPTQLRVSQIMKGTPAERIQSPKVQQLSNVGFQVRVPSVERSPATVDEKTLVKPKRLTQNTVLPKNLASVQIQKLPNTSMHSDFATIGQVVKITSSPSDSSQRQSFENLESTPSGKITMSSSRATPKRAPAARTLTNSPVAKKKCVKKMSPEKISGLNNLEARTPKGIEMQNRGLTITPIATSSSAVNTKATAESSIISSGSQVVRCPYCEKHSFRFDYCEHCGEVLPVNAPKYRLKKLSEIPMASRETVMVTKNVTTTSTIEKKIVYHLPDGMGPVNQSYQSISMRENVVFETSSPLGTRGGRGRGKTRRKAEPVCYTLSSDDDEPPVVMHPMQASSIHSSQVYNPNESEGSKSDHSSNSEMLHNELHDENQEDSDDLQYPGVTDINPNIEEDEPEEEMEFEAEEIEEEEENFSEECEEEEEEIPEEEHNEGESLAQSGRHPSLRCRSIRIGSYKVHPRPTQPFVAVVLDEGRIAFNAPIISDPGGTQVHITLGSEDVHKMYFHFGRCLPVMFITTTPKFGGLVRTALHMIENETPYFDPSTKDDKTQKLTFLIESISEQQKSFLKTKFAGDNKTIEIDQKTANEILVKSTPNQNAVLQLKRPDPVPTVSSEPRLPQISNQASEGKENSEQPQEQNTDFSTKQQDNLKLQSDMPVLVAISPLNNRIPNDKCNTEKLTLVHQQGHNKDSESQTSQVILENSVSNGYISQLQAENKRLHLLLASLNRHPVIEVSNPIKNLRKENKKLKGIQSKLRKEITELKLEAKMFPSFESKCDSIEKLVQDFKQSLESQQVDISNCIQLEHRLNSAMTESQNLHEIVDSSQQQIKNVKQNIEKNQKPSSAVGNLEHIPLEKEILSPIKENNQPKNAIETNSTSSSVSVMENIPFDGESSNLPCIIDPKLTLTYSKNRGGVPIINLCNVPSLSTSSRNDENDVQTVEQSPESSNTKHTLPSANDFDSSSTGKSFMRYLKDNRNNKLKTIISKYEYSPSKQKENDTRKSVITNGKRTKEDTVNNLESCVVLNTSNTATFESSSSGSEKTTPNSSFVAIHRNDINHTKKCMEQAHIKIRNKETKNCNVSSSSENDCFGTCRLISSSFKQLLNASYTTSTSITKESLLNDDNVLGKNVQIASYNTSTSITKESLLEDDNVLSKNEQMGEENNTIDINISSNKINKNIIESDTFKDILPSKKQKYNLNSSFSEMKDGDCTIIDGDSSCSLQDADDNSTDSNFPDKAILLKLPLRLNFKRTPNNSPKQNADTVSLTSATANICKRISERATYLQDWNSKMAQPKNGLQTSHSNCDSLLSTSANNIKRPLSFSIPIAVSLTENQKDSKPLSSNVNNTDFCNFNNVSVGNYIGSDNLPSRTTSSGEKKINWAEIDVESTVETQQNASLTSSPKKLVKNNFLLNIDKSGELSVPPGTLNMMVKNCLNMKNLSVRKDGTLFHNWKKLT